MHEVCSLKEVLRLEVYVILDFESSINSLQFFQCVFEACLDSYPFHQFCKCVILSGQKLFLNSQPLLSCLSNYFIEYFRVQITI